MPLCSLERILLYLKMGRMSIGKINLSIFCCRTTLHLGKGSKKDEIREPIWYSRVATQNEQKGSPNLMNRLTQDIKFRWSLMQDAEKYGVARASRKHNKGASCSWFWKAGYDGSVESLACRPWQPHSHPNQPTEAHPEHALLRLRVRHSSLYPAPQWQGRA